MADQLMWIFITEQKISCCICIKPSLSSLSNISALFPCFLTQGTSHSDFHYPGAEDKSLSKTQLESTVITIVWCRAARMEGQRNTVLEKQIKHPCSKSE